MAAKNPDWVAIKREWDAGQLSLATIAGLHGDGISKQAISARAKRQAWPDRPALNGRVDARVDDSVDERAASSRSSTPVNNGPSVALALFARVMGVLMTERGDLRELGDHYSWLMGKIRAKRADIDTGGNGRKAGAMSLREMQMFGALLKDLAMTKRTVIPLIRRAYGLTDEDGPSELDRLTDEQLAAAEEKLRTVLNELGISV